MSKLRGRNVRITPFRRLVIDVMAFSQKVPTVTVERRMNLSRLVAARQLCNPRPTWTAVFTKAYALVAAHEPLLRRCYMAFPWPRFYEHPKNIATLNIGRRVDEEEIVLHAPMRSPEKRSLAQIDTIIRHFMDTPVNEISSYCRARRVSCLPGPLRRLLMWATLNMFGQHRCHNFGTFGITSVAGQGAGILNLVPLLTSTLHYGLLNEKGCLDVRLAFDHRVLDGALAAESLLHLEVTLLSAILDEVRSQASSSSQPPLAA